MYQRQRQRSFFINADNSSAVVFVFNRIDSGDSIEEVAISNLTTGPDMIFNYRTEMAQ